MGLRDSLFCLFSLVIIGWSVRSDQFDCFLHFVDVMHPKYVVKIFSE
jgi:hypothetical protein